MVCHDALSGGPEQLQEEYDAIGFFISAHPLDAYAEALRRLDVTNLRDVPKGFAGGRDKFKLAGTVIARSDRRTKDGKPFCRISLSDPTGTFEVAFFSDGFTAARDVAVVGAQIYITVTARGEDAEDIRLMGDSCRVLESVVSDVDARLEITLTQAESMTEIAHLLDSAKGGKGRVLILARPDNRHFEAKIDLDSRYVITPGLAEAIRVLPGVHSAEAV